MSTSHHLLFRKTEIFHQNGSIPSHSSGVFLHNMETRAQTQFVYCLYVHYLTMSPGISIFRWASSSSYNKDTLLFSILPVQLPSNASCLVLSMALP